MESPHRFARLTVPEDYRKLDKLPPHRSIHLLIESIVAYQRYLSPIRLRKRLAVGLEYADDDAVRSRRRCGCVHYSNGDGNSNGDGSAVAQILANYVFDRCAATSRSPGLIVIVNGAASSWLSSTLTSRTGMRCGGQMRRPLAVIWLTTPAITTNLATAESQ
jgi:hypothetical protein